jgi:hypothetical protein
MPTDPEEEEMERHLRNLLAVVHRDGGHYTSEHGIEKSVKDAMELVPLLRADKDCLRDQILAYQKDLALCRRIFYYMIKKDLSPVTAILAERTLKELKQK